MKVNWPDLHALIAKFGSYGAIPSAAWAEYDQAAVDAQRAYRRSLPAPSGKQNRQPKKD